MADGTAVAAQSRWFSAAELAGLPGLPGTERRVRSRAAIDGWQSRPRSGRGGGVEYPFASLPAATQAALLLRERRAAPPQPRPGALSQAQAEELWTRYDRRPTRVKDVAMMRLRAINAVEQLMAGGLGLMDARATVAAELTATGSAVSPVTLANWQAMTAHADRKDWLALLLPQHCGRTATAEIPTEAWDFFKADYLRVEQPSATSCYDRLQRISRTKEWGDLPSLRTFVRRLERELPRAVLVLARKGEEAMEKLYPAQERDRSVFKALEAVNADGHRWDIMVRFPNGEIGRPSILGWQDIFSGKLLGYRLTDHESSDAVRLSLADVVREYGIPEHAYLDNGRAFASKWMTGGTPNRYRFKVREEDPVGLLVALQIEVHWVTPYHGQAKPIERCWRDFCDRIAKHPAFAGAYTGNNPMAKPENYGSRAVEWDLFARVVAEEIAAHNARDGRRTPVCLGRSFDTAFAASYAHAVIRKATEAQLRTLLLAAQAVTAGEDGSVRLAGNRYWTEALSQYAGRKLVLRVDPDHLHGHAEVYALDGTHLATAPCVASVGFADTHAAREHQRARKQWGRARKAQLAAEQRMDAATVAAQLPSVIPATLPEASVIAPVFRSAAKQATPAEDSALAATGTDDGLTSADLLILARMKQRSEDAI